MRFKLQTDYALKALLYLTSRQGTNCTTEEIANLYQISAAHLGRVIRRLQRHGYVKAIRGRRGGVRLNCDPNELSLGQVVETLEEGGNLLELPTEGGEGAWAQAQRMKAVLRRGQGLFLNYLFQVTLAEMAESGTAPPEVSAPQHESNGESTGAPMPEPMTQAPAASEERPSDAGMPNPMAMMEREETVLSGTNTDHDPLSSSPSLY